MYVDFAQNFLKIFIFLKIVEVTKKIRFYFTKEFSFSNFDYEQRETRKNNQLSSKLQSRSPKCEQLITWEKLISYRKREHANRFHGKSFIVIAS